MTREDLEREQRIDMAYFDLLAANTPSKRKEVFDRMCAEVRQRSQVRVAEMEHQKGLTR